MESVIEKLGLLSPEVLRGIRRGIEKEGLRVNADGALAQTPHPPGLGSALTHPHITTDFSESQLELITDAHTGVQACLDELTAIHQIVYRHLGDELLWGPSMPCKLPAEDEIPLGRYGTSNLGRAKTIYRNGLAHRYGRRMQTISGVHYNFSLPETTWPLLFSPVRDASPAELQAEGYFHLIRNFRRHSWLLLYLFGASPAVCRSFVAGRAHRLQTLHGGTLYLPGATSLRMGPLGYQSDAQAALAVSFNGLRQYALSLNAGLTRPYPPYEALGLRDAHGYRQLATTLLQIENEFYSTIRPKPLFRSGERPLFALGERGVNYIEVRCIDNDPFSPIGIAANTIRFLDIFLLHCLLADSPPDTPAEIAALSRNQHDVAQRGRDPGTQLIRGNASVALTQWARELVDACAPIAASLDAAHGVADYGATLAAAAAAIENPDLTRSARVLAAIERSSDRSYLSFALDRSRQNKRDLLALPLQPGVEAEYRRMAEDSIAKQKAIEASDQLPFEDFRRDYLGKDLMSGALLQAASTR